jgi:hypothetical protein
MDKSGEPPSLLPSPIGWERMRPALAGPGEGVCQSVVVVAGRDSRRAAA